MNPINHCCKRRYRNTGLWYNVKNLREKDQVIASNQQKYSHVFFQTNKHVGFFFIDNDLKSEAKKKRIKGLLINQNHLKEIYFFSKQCMFCTLVSLGVLLSCIVVSYIE